MIYDILFWLYYFDVYVCLDKIVFLFVSPRDRWTSPSDRAAPPFIPVTILLTLPPLSIVNQL